jgi:hypothetical protein
MVFSPLEKEQNDRLPTILNSDTDDARSGDIWCIKIHFSMDDLNSRIYTFYQNITSTAILPTLWFWMLQFFSINWFILLQDPPRTNKFF